MRIVVVVIAAAIVTELWNQQQGRCHGRDWGGHVHPTFARGRVFLELTLIR